ncbi:polysaccharide biosynthesis/export family protein [Aquamicrobium segne]|uniref:Polysaccharide biosynthesis/export family protein n=1 Tax=Aquamicrobium segne TaxID=469547 RepID=A0ABW0GY33_9HYPH
MTRTLPAIMLAILCFVAGCNSTANTGAAPADVLALQTGDVTATADGSLRLVKSLPAPAGTHDGTEQLLAANDVLEINVYNADTLNRVVQVDPSGRISLPLIGVQMAAGKSVRQLEQDLEKAYGTSYLQSPDITVFLKESASQRVTVDGEVAKAGLYQVAASTTLLDAIALAGGLRDIADPSKVYVFRNVGGARLVANYSVEQIRSGRLANPRIYGGDVIMVFTSQNRVAINNLKEALGMAANASRLAVIP